MRLTKAQAKRALTEWRKVSESAFWDGLKYAIEDKKSVLARLLATEYSEPDRLYRLQGRYEAFNMDFDRVVKNYVKYLEEEAG